jgi:hypothetical protein
MNVIIWFRPTIADKTFKSISCHFVVHFASHDHLFIGFFSFQISLKILFCPYILEFPGFPETYICFIFF